MKRMFVNFVRTFSFLDKHYFKYSVGIIGSTAIRCTSSLIQVYLLQYILDVGQVNSIYYIIKMFGYLFIYILMLLLLLPIFQFWFNGEAKYGHGSVNKSIYNKFGDLSMHYYDTHNSGTIMSVFLNDTWGVASILMRHLKRVVAACVSIIVYIIPMFVFDYRLTLIVIFTNIITMMVNVKVSQKLKDNTAKIQEKLEMVTFAITEAIDGMPVIRIFQLDKQINNEFEKKNNSVYKLCLDKAKLMGRLGAYNCFVKFFNVVLFLILGYMMVEQGLSSYANILSIMTLQTSLEGGFRELAEFFPVLLENFAITERVNGFLNEEEEVLYNKSEKKVKGGFVELKGLSFSYPGSQKMVFENFNMIVKEGEFIAIAGDSGSGKSTIAKILIGLYQANQGLIFVEGENKDTIPISTLRERVAYVPQRPNIFNETIFENIKYGRYNATYDEIEEATRVVYAYDFIMKQDNGFETIIGENGSGLSVGQCQRIEIARAVLKDAPIIILDEATSALDNITERCVLESLKKKWSNKTVIMIAHSKNALDFADRVIRI